LRRNPLKNFQDDVGSQHTVGSTADFDQFEATFQGAVATRIIDEVAV